MRRIYYTDFLRPQKSLERIRTELSESDLSSDEFKQFYKRQKQQRPFCRDYIGFRNPYTGDIVHSEADYYEYLREHSYYALRDEKARKDLAVMRGNYEQRLQKQKAHYLRICTVLFLLLVASVIVGIVRANNTREASYQRGLDSGSSSGYSEGYEVGESIGYASGYEDGESSGYQRGFSEGEKRAKASSGFSSGIVGNGHYTSPTAAGAPREDPIADTYIGNKKTKKFHKATCSWLPDQNNQVSFDTREEAIDAGYSPCQRCNP